MPDRAAGKGEVLRRLSPFLADQAEARIGVTGGRLQKLSVDPELLTQV